MWERGALALALAVAALVPAGAGLGASRLAAFDRTELGSLLGHDVTTRGYVAKRERPSFGASRFRLRVRTIAAGPGIKKVDELVQVRLARRTPAPALSIGDEVEATGTLVEPRSPPGQEFDHVAYLRRAGVHAVLRARWVRRTGKRRPGLEGAIDSVRRRAEAGVSAGLDPPLAALARGMVLGEDEDISPAMSDDFKRSGLAHVLAVSGQNVTLLAVLAWPLLGFLGTGRRARLAIVLGLIALYVPLTGAGPSIMRAGVMGMAGTVAALSGRPASRWYGLLLAAAVTLAVDPRAWLDVGWQLSFAAVVGIFFLQPALRRAFVRLPEPVAAGAALTAAATIATAPLMAFHFERVSLVSLAANLAALPAIAPVMWIGMLSSTVAQVWLPPAEAMNALNGYLLGYVASVAHWSAESPAAVWSVRLGSAAALAAAYAGLAAAVLTGRWLLSRPSNARLRLRAVALPGALVLAVAAVWLATARPLPGPPDGFRASFLDVGQGDATLFQAPGGRAVLVDGGPPEANVLAKLRQHGVRALDVVVLTHAQRDHEGGLEAVVDALPVALLIDGGAGSPEPLHRRIAAAARARGVRVLPGREGEILHAGPLRLRVLSPPSIERPAPGDDPNLRAIVLLVSYAGLDFLMTADAESDVTASLPLRPVDVLKVAHHGSADDGLGSLLDRVRPQEAVIEVGAGNPYGHPDRRTVATLEARVPDLYRTDRDGEIGITLGPRGAYVSAAGRSGSARLDRSDGEADPLP